MLYCPLCIVIHLGHFFGDLLSKLTIDLIDDLNNRSHLRWIYECVLVLVNLYQAI